MKKLVSILMVVTLMLVGIAYANPFKSAVEGFEDPAITVNSTGNKIMDSIIDEQYESNSSFDDIGGDEEIKVSNKFQGVGNTIEVLDSVNSVANTAINIVRVLGILIVGVISASML
jgi:hypothetical protein